MKFKCNQKDLAEVINIVQKAVSSKTTLPILKGILVEASEQSIKMTGNDLNIGIESQLKAEVLESGSIVISSRLFGDIIRKLPNEEITIETDAQNNVLISCLHSNFNLVGQPALEFPELPEVEDINSFAMSQNLFRNMIRQTSFAASQDETRPILTGSLIEIDQGMMSMVAIDGYRLALRKAFVQTDQTGKAVVPSKTLNELGKIISGTEEDQDVKIAITDKHILFELEGIKIVSRLLEGEFIKYTQIIPQEFKSRLNVNTSSLLNSIERASLLAREGKNSSIKFTIQDDFLTIRSNVEVGSAKEDVAIQLEGDDLEIGFNPKYLVDALKVIDSDEISIELTTSVSPCIMKPNDNENYIYLVLPVRMPNT